MRYNHAILSMHVAALLWGLSGILGSITTVDSSIIAFGRAIFALLIVYFWFGSKDIRTSLHLTPRVLALLGLTGFCLGIHWIFFFLSIVKGGVAIGLVTYTASSTLIAIFEVVLGFARARLMTFFAAFLSFAGIYVIHPITSVASLMNEGFLYGMLATLFISIGAVNGRRLLLTKRIDSIALTIGQLVGVIIVTSPFVLYHVAQPITVKDILAIAGLGIFCSAIGQTMFNRALSSVQASTASIISNMEAPYGIILAALLLSQPITLTIVIGMLLVTGSALLVSLPKKEREVRIELESVAK